MKRILKWFLILLLTAILFLGTLVLFTLVPFNIELKKDGFELDHKISRAPSPYDSNGSDWGHNQTKLASLNNLIFTFNYDNSNLANGNSSDQNPYTCEFVYIKDDIEHIIDSKPCNRPGNVLTDTVNSKVYYILSEPTGPAYDSSGEDFTNFATTKMYEYSYAPSTDLLTLIEEHSVTPSTSDGKIRQGVAIDPFGNIVIAYGSYDGYMNIYTFDLELRAWDYLSFLSNDTFDSLMYASVAMKDLDHIYILAEQDTSNDDGVFYQYVKFFAIEDGNITGTIIADYRNHELADKYEKMVRNADIEIYNGEVHMIAVASKFFEVTYYVYSDNTFTIQDTSYMNKDIKNAKFFIQDNELYISSMSLKFGALIPTFNIYDVANQTKIYTLSSTILNNYFYIASTETELYLLLYSRSKGSLYYIKTNAS